MKKIRYNTTAEVEGILDDALTLVAKLEPTDDLRAPLFEKACDLLAGQQVFFTQADAAEHVSVPTMALPTNQRH